MSDGRHLRGSFTLVAVVAALVVVVAAATGSEAPPLQGPTRGWARWVLDAGGAILAITCAAGIAVLVYSLWPGRPRPRRRDDESQHMYEPPPAPWWEKLLAVALPFVMLSVLVWLVFGLRGGKADRPGGLATEPALSVVSAPAPAPPSDTTDRQGPFIDWWIVGGSVVVAAVTFGSVVVAGGRRRLAFGGRSADARAAAPDLPQLVELSIDALEREPEPRRAVIAAYSRMEAWLAATGLPRKPWETPFEYLDRVLVEFGATATIAATLTELFERAKFAAHPITAGMKRVALDALVELRGELGRVA